MAKSRSGVREGAAAKERRKWIATKVCGAAVLRCARWLAHFAPRKLDSYLKTEREEMVSWKLERNSAGSTLFLQLDGDKLRGGNARGGRRGTETGRISPRIKDLQ